MTRIYVQNIEPKTESSVDFRDVVSANNDPQWIDTYGVIKTNKNRIDENVTIPTGTNGLTVGTVTVGSGYTVTVQGEWRIV